MRILLVLTSCFGLAFFAGAAQHDDQDNNNQGKKKGGGNTPSQQVTTQQTGKVYKGGPHTANLQQPSTVHYKGAGKNGKWQGPVTGGNQTNVSGNAQLHTGHHNKDLPAVQSANTTTFNKANKLTVNKTNFHVQHFNLGNQPNGKYQAVKFNGNYQIAGAHNWKGSKYIVFQNYHPQWHDQYWWTSHHNHIVFVFGAPYFWDSGYWYPAWGYNPGANYYYDGPIYASNPEYDPGQVVANVQSALQQQGYYQGEVDGILGPQTRAALAEYQSAQGLEATGAVDEPTLETLGMV